MRRLHPLMQNANDLNRVRRPDAIENNVYGICDGVSPLSWRL
jgi:hypothetical protein